MTSIEKCRSWQEHNSFTLEENQKYLFLQVKDLNRQWQFLQFSGDQSVKTGPEVGVDVDLKLKFLKSTAKASNNRKNSILTAEVAAELFRSKVRKKMFFFYKGR